MADRGSHLPEAEERYRILLDIIKALTAPFDRKNLFSSVASALRGSVPFDRMGIGVAEPERDEFVLYAYEAQNEPVNWMPGARFPLDGTVPGWVIRRRRPYITRDLEQISDFPEWREFLRRDDMSSGCVLPLEVGDQCIGFLAVLAREPGTYREGELHFYQQVAQAVAVALDRCLAHGAVASTSTEPQRVSSQQQALLGITRAVAVHRKREDLFRAIAVSITSVVTFDRLAVFIPRAEERDLLVYAIGAEDKTSFQAGNTYPTKGTAPAWVIANRRVLVASSLADLEPFPTSHQVLTALGIRSCCILPLVVRGRSLGALALDSKEEGHYGAADLAVLREVADAVAIGLDNCLSYEEIAALKERYERESTYLQHEIDGQYLGEMIGRSKAIAKLAKDIEIVAPTSASVFILGETGTGKELVARALHRLGPSANKPLVKLNCSAIPSGLIESELFGHEKGAFTGAHARKIGRFELANGGTIFLDEIADLPVEMQTKLLRVLQEEEFERVGGSETIKIKVRVIAATNADLDRAMEAGTFRMDLYYRLHVFPIRIPPLRERAEDIPLLVEHFLKKFAARFGRKIVTVRPETMEVLVGYSWPGNVRELENVIERAVIISRGPSLELGEWMPKPGAPDRPGQVATLEDVTRAHIVSVLERTGWQVSGEAGAAKILGVKPTTLEARIRRLGIRKS
ncbi:MAG: sigma 54-interacting transcriptional regulator [Planctomycetes bacterium]|nr:sigma 54-interacting transcriptional regulator [Planctomycetota bacterium]